MPPPEGHNSLHHGNRLGASSTVALQLTGSLEPRGLKSEFFRDWRKGVGEMMSLRLGFVFQFAKILSTEFNDSMLEALSRLLGTTADFSWCFWGYIQQCFWLCKTFWGGVTSIYLAKFGGGLIFIGKGRTAHDSEGAWPTHSAMSQTIEVKSSWVKTQSAIFSSLEELTSNLLLTSGLHVKRTNDVNQQEDNKTSLIAYSAFLL